MPDSAIGDIIVRLTLGGNIRVEDLAVILSASDTGTLRYLHDTADEVRKKTVGNAVLLRGIIETSNICHQHCRYCGLRKENTKIHRYRMAEGEILAVAKKISACGISTVVLQSGEDLMAGSHLRPDQKNQGGNGSFRYPVDRGERLRRLSRFQESRRRSLSPQA